MMKRRFAAATLVAASVMLSALVSLSRAQAAPSDIVPRGSSLLDTFVVLSKSDSLVGKDHATSDFLGSRLYSRGELAQILERDVLSDKAALKGAEGGADTGAALRAAVVELRDELRLDGYDADAIRRATSDSAASYDLMLQAEGRDNSDQNKNKGRQLHSGGFGIYRGTVQGDAGPSARYAISVSNQYEDYRRYFQNDIGPHDFNALQEAYVEFNNSRGLRFDVGRMYDRWGPGYRGTTLLSDNSPPFDQLKISFPFSLGKRLGRNYTYEQMATFYKETGTTRYLEARRIGYQFSKQWNLTGSESFKSTDSTSLAYTPIPFDIGQGIRLNKAQYQFNYNLDLALTYSPAVNTRLYGQLYVDDIKSPFNSGHLFGFSIGGPGNIPRKIAYLVGGHTETSGGTGLTLEYDFSDPNTYTYRNFNAIWQHGRFDWIGLPDGPDSKELYARIDQKVGKALTLAAEYRDRRRTHDSWLAPTSKEYGAEGSYQFDNRDSLGVAYTNYKQDPYPFVIGAPGSPLLNQTLAPLGEGDIGQYLRASEFDFSFKHVF